MLSAREEQQRRSAIALRCKPEDEEIARARRSETDRLRPVGPVEEPAPARSDEQRRRGSDWARIPADRHSEMRAARAEGATLAEIAVRFKLSKRAVGRALQREDEAHHGRP
jgi:hypothetical protein